MANLIIVDEAIDRALDNWTGKTTNQDWKDAKVGLFTAPTTISRNTALADIVAATFAGYAQITLTGSTWLSATVSAHVASAIYGATLTWTRSTSGSPQTVYGMYATNNAGTKLLGVALFDGGPYPVTNAGDAINEALTLDLQSLYS